MIKTLIFDLDDTLYRELDFVYGSFSEVANFIIQCQPYLVDKGISTNQLYQEMINILQREGRGKIFNQIIDKYELDIEIKALVKVYRQAIPTLKLYNDANDILRWAKAQDYYTGIITDGNSQVQHNKIKSLQLDNYVDEIVVTYDFGEEYSKPHPRAYLHMLEHFECKPKQMIYIGDNPNKDFIGARELGIHTIRIVRECGDHMQIRLHRDYEADYEVNTLELLKKIINQINYKD